MFKQYLHPSKALIKVPTKFNLILDKCFIMHRDLLNYIKYNHFDISICPTHISAQLTATLEGMLLSDDFDFSTVRHTLSKYHGG